MEINKLLTELIELTCSEHSEAFRAKAQDLINCLAANINNPEIQAGYPICKTVLSALSDRQLAHLLSIRDAIKPPAPDLIAGTHVGLSTWVN